MLTQYYQIFFFLLEYNCFTMLCQFLLYNEVNQLYVYIYLHIRSLLDLPPTPPSHPSRSPQCTELNSLCYTRYIRYSDFYREAGISDFYVKSSIKILTTKSIFKHYVSKTEYACSLGHVFSNPQILLYRMQVEQTNLYKNKPKNNQNPKKETLNPYNVSYRRHLRTDHSGLISQNLFLNKVPKSQAASSQKRNLRRISLFVAPFRFSILELILAHHNNILRCQKKLDFGRRRS